MQKFNDLYDFVDTAVRSRKYPDTTGSSLKVALRLFEAELNEEEQKSIEKLKQNLDQIYQTVVRKNMKEFSASSLATYKSRVVKVLGDFERYGVDPTKMASWSPKLITRARKNAPTSAMPEAAPENTPTAVAVAGTHRIELSLRPDAKDVRFVIIVPQDIQAKESTTIKAVLDSLVKTDK